MVGNAFVTIDAGLLTRKQEALVRLKRFFASNGVRKDAVL